MNKSDARKIAETITTEQLKNMFRNAKENIVDWERVSSVNKGMTIGTSWNILTKCVDTSSNLAKSNMIREFGDYLDQSMRPVKRKKKVVQHSVCHQEPNLNINF
jgi:hypothetical protein